MIDNNKNILSKNKMSDELIKNETKTDLRDSVTASRKQNLLMIIKKIFETVLFFAFGVILTFIFKFTFIN